MRKGLAFLLLQAALAGFALPQALPPSKPVSKAERTAIFRKNLETDKVPKGAVELELRALIPSDAEIARSEIFFKNVLCFDIDDRGHIYIPDGVLCDVYELDASGKLVNRYDKQGQGPGEMRFPTSVQFYQKEVVINDGGNLRVSFFDRNWKFLRSFRRLKSFFPFILGSDGQFYGASRQNDKLISVLDLDGKPLRSFGELEFQGAASILNNCELGISSEGTLWVGTSSLGKLRRYSRSGTIEVEIDLTKLVSGFVRSLIKENLAMPAKGINGSFPIIKSLDFVGEDVLVLTGGLVQPIFRFSPDGTLAGSFFIPPQEGMNFFDMHVLMTEEGEERFYILRHDCDGEVRIGLYGRKAP